MGSTQDLEAILSKFDAHKELFHYPFTFSLENRGVVGKYICSMLKMAETEEQASRGISPESIIKNFCERYHADETEMHTLLSDPENNWFDYRLYTCFRSFIQRELEVDTDTLFRETTLLSFTDKDSRQIRVAKYVPLSMILTKMDQQFPNFSRVTQVKSRKVYPGSVRISRRTFDYHTKELLDILGPELTISALQDDCEFTRYAFITTFQQLYGQKELQVIREKSETDDISNILSLIHKQPLHPRLITEDPPVWATWAPQESQGCSQYLVAPTRPYRSILFGWAEKIGDFLVERKQLRRDNAEMRQELFGARTDFLEKSAELTQMTAEARRNLQLAGGLAEELAEARSAGESHFLKNKLQSLLTAQEERYADQMAQAILFAATLPSLAPEIQQQITAYLNEASATFGIKPADFRSKDTLMYSLRKVEVTINAASTCSAGMDEDIASLFEALSEEVKLDPAYAKFKEVQQRYKNANPDVPLFDFDPFVLFYSLREIQEGIALVRERMTRLGKMESIKEVRFSDALEEAVEMICSDKALPYDKNNIIKEIGYDPNFTTVKDLLVFTLKDLLNNGKKVGSPNMRVTTINPNRFEAMEELPLQEHFSLPKFPALYLVVENFFPEMTSASYAQLQRKAEELNATLRGEIEDGASISTTLMGGQGTPYLRNFYRMHNGQGLYLPSLERKNMGFHSYFIKLGM